MRVHSAVMLKIPSSKTPGYAKHLFIMQTHALLTFKTIVSLYWNPSIVCKDRVKYNIFEFIASSKCKGSDINVLMIIRSQKSEQCACVYLERIKIRCTYTYISNILILFLPEKFSRMI